MEVLVSKSWCRNFGFVQSVGYPAFIGIETVWSLNSKLRASLREAFIYIARSIKLNPQYPYIPLVIVGPRRDQPAVDFQNEKTAGAGVVRQMVPRGRR